MDTAEDADIEGDETFTVGLTVSETTAEVTATDTATGTITDDHNPKSIVLSAVTVADASAVEGDPITFTVTLDKAVTGGFKVTPSLYGRDGDGGDGL